MITFQKIIILLLHFVLLGWIVWLLQETGRMNSKEVLYHFCGVGAYGALLIRGCAWWAKHHFVKEQVQRHAKKHR